MPPGWFSSDTEMKLSAAVSKNCRVAAMLVVAFGVASAAVGALEPAADTLADGGAPEAAVRLVDDSVPSVAALRSPTTEAGSHSRAVATVATPTQLRSM